MCFFSLIIFSVCVFRLQSDRHVYAMQSTYEAPTCLTSHGIGVGHVRTHASLVCPVPWRAQLEVSINCGHMGTLSRHIKDTLRGTFVLT